MSKYSWRFLPINKSTLLHNELQFSKLSNHIAEKFTRKIVFLMVVILVCGACATNQVNVKPSIEFTKVPRWDVGGPVKQDSIEGRVTGARPGQKIVLYARSGQWWVQPFTYNPMTDIEPDSTWKNQTHLGTDYAALLVEADYRPAYKRDKLPEVGDKVVAVASVEAIPVGGTPPVPKTVQFSGYEWQVRSGEIDRKGEAVDFDSDNVWTDEKGFLHLRISKKGENWTCAELMLTRSLGYGTYRFVVRDISNLDPAAVLNMSTWDELNAGQYHREMDIEITRWGDPTSRNLQYIIKPDTLATNVVRFSIPAGIQTHSLQWQQGTALFKTVRGAGADVKAEVIAEHQFSSGVPTPGGERIHMILYPSKYTKSQLQKETEVIIEKFEYLP
jgi:hypothetical protein